MSARPHQRILLALGLGIGLASGLAACGSGDSASGPDTAAFSSAFSSGFTTLKTSAGLSSSAFADLFDTTYVDAGITKADIVAALQAEANAAAAASSTYPSFPQVTVSDIVITGCDNASQLCQFTATVTNNDADATSVTFTSLVKFTDKVRLFGDQTRS